MRYLIIVVGAVLVNNFVLNRFLGCCPFLGVSKKTETALGMSGAVVFVMTIASAVTWCLDQFLLKPNGLGYIHTLAFILVIASLVQFIDIAMKRFMPPLHAALGIFLPLITTNCAVLGVAEMNAKSDLNFFGAVLYSFAAAIGFGLALESAPLLPRRCPGARHGRIARTCLHGLLRPCEGGRRPQDLQNLSRPNANR